MLIRVSCTDVSQKASYKKVKRSLNNSYRDCGDINTNRDSVLESTHGTRRCAVSNVYHDEG